jgi:hypothetical protein
MLAHDHSPDVIVVAIFSKLLANIATTNQRQSALPFYVTISKRESSSKTFFPDTILGILGAFSK